MVEEKEAVRILRSTFKILQDYVNRQPTPNGEMIHLGTAKQISYLHEQYIIDLLIRNLEKEDKASDLLPLLKDALPFGEPTREEISRYKDARGKLMAYIKGYSK